MMLVVRKQNPLVLAVFAAFLLHVLFFLAFVLLVHTGYFGADSPEPEMQTTLTLMEPPASIPEEFLPPEPEPPVVQEPAPQAFVDSTAQPEEAPPTEPAPFISDRNVTASAENPDGTGDMPVPTQEGHELPGIEVTDQRYTDGPAPQPAPQSTPQPPSPQLAVVQPSPPQPAAQPQEQQPSPTQSQTPTENPQEVEPEDITPQDNPDQPLDEAPEDPQPTDNPAEIAPETPPEIVEEPQETPDLEYQPALPADLLALLEARSPEQPQAPEPLPAPQSQSVQDQQQPQPDSPNQPTREVDIQELLEAQRRRAAPNSQSSFQRERALTELEGSITNKGSNQVGSEKTPLGAYYKSISNAIGPVWQRKTSRNADLFRIGTVKIRFRVYPSGRISAISVEENTGNEVFANLSIEAIQESAIPAMPPEVRDLTQGEPLSITFTFVMM